MTRVPGPAEQLRTDADAFGLRLSDLIPALKAQHGSALALLRRIDPEIADELFAFAVHRHVTLTDLAADCLEQLALEAADTIWQIGVERHGDFEEDAEASLLGTVLRKSIRNRLHRENLIVSDLPVAAVFMSFSRSGHPYTMA
jgi:hypothetical protein